LELDMKIIYCEYCDKKVAEIESGSKIRKGTVFVCRECDNPEPPKPNDETLDALREIMGMRNPH